MLATAWPHYGFDAYGFKFNDKPPPGYCYDNYLCSRNKGTVLDISTHSYCVETKFCHGRFVVKWCPEHLADFATDSPTPRPAA